jgi:hypothetical protein
MPVDNVPLREAIAAFAEKPEQSTYLDVVRNCLQGELLLDSTGSDRPSIADDGAVSYPPGSRLQFAGGTGPDGEPALFAFTSQEQVVRMHPDDPAAVQTIVQPAAGALELITSDRYGWIYIDPAGPTCAITRKDATFALGGARNDDVKEAIPLGNSAVLSALAQNGPLLLAVEASSVPASGMADGDTPVRIRTSDGPNGETMLLAFTSGPEVSARNVEDAFATRPAMDIVAQAAAPPYDGLVINPGGPWAAFSSDELRALL